MRVYFTAYGVVQNCSGFRHTDGTIGASTVAGGDTTPYRFTWSDGAVGIQREGLKAGPYTLTVATSDTDQVSHTFYVRQPRLRVPAPGTFGNARQSRFSARNNWLVEDTPKASLAPPVTTAGSYTLSSEGITEGSTNSQFGVANGVWHANNLASSTFAVANSAGSTDPAQASLTFDATGIHVAIDSCIYFGGGLWRLRYETLNGELVFELLEDGVWLRRFIVD
jgi:hypothetical protein